MKTIKQLFYLTLLIFSSVTYAQVGIGTSTPNHALEVESTDSGLVIPRVASTAAVTVTPVDGTLIYDISTNCVKAFENGAWSDCFSAGGGVGSSQTVRVATTNAISDADLNNIIVSGASGLQYSLAGLSPSEGDTLTITDGVGNGTTSFDNASGSGLTGQATLLAPGGGITIVYDADTDEWYTVSAF